MAPRRSATRPTDARSASSPDHADLVRDIFRRYLACGNVRLLDEQLRAEDIAVPARTRTNGSAIGGGWFQRGQLYTILRNRIYVGEIVHKGNVYPGLHPAIIERGLFDRVQALLASNRQGHASGVRAKQPSLLAGRVVDQDGKALIATHATKNSTRYRYYASQGSDAVRVPARERERAVVQRLAEALEPHALVSAPWLAVAVSDYAGAIARIAEVAARVRQGDRTLIRLLVSSVTVEPARLVVRCATAELAAALSIARHEDAPAELVLEVAVAVLRSGMAMRLVHESGARIEVVPEASMLCLLARAHRLWGALKTGELNIAELAEQEGVSRSYISRLVRLAFLSPAVTQALLKGEQRDRVDVGVLTAPDAIDACWKKQAGQLLPSA